MFEYSLENPSHVILRYYSSADGNRLNVINFSQKRMRHRFMLQLVNVYVVLVSEHKAFHKQKHSDSRRTPVYQDIYISFVSLLVEKSNNIFIRWKDRLTRHRISTILLIDNYVFFAVLRSVLSYLSITVARF